MTVVSFRIALIGLFTVAAFLPATASCYNSNTERWHNFLQKFAKDWRGRYIRADITGTQSSTNITRRFTIPKNESARALESMLNTNLYANPRWNENGDVVRHWLHTLTTFRRLYDNGTAGAGRPIQGILPTKRGHIRAVDSRRHLDD